MATKQNSKRAAKQRPLTDNPGPNFAPAITKSQMETVERRAQEWGVTRRLGYATLTQSSGDLLRTAKDQQGAEALMSIVESLGQYLKWRERETEMLSAAHARAMHVLSFLYEPAHQSEGQQPEAAR